MKTRMIRLRFDPDKEERWLNDMSAKGLALCDNFMVRYTFEDTEPGKYIFRVVFLDKLFWTAEMRRYIQFIEDSGAECVGAYGRWACFRKLAADGPFEVYTDIASKIRLYRGMAVMYGLLGVSQIFFFISRLIDILFNYHSELSFMLPIAVLHGLLLAVLASMFARTIYKISRLKKEAQIRE